MPIVDGKVVRARYTSLKLDELSAVDNPAQPGALALIMKRHDPSAIRPSDLAASVAKMMGESDEAVSFREAFADHEFSSAIWPMIDALSTSVRSIMSDEDLSGADRDSKLAQSVDEFLSAVRSKAPAEVEKIESELARLSKGEGTMKTIEQLTTEVEKLTGQATALNAQIAKLTSEREAEAQKAKAAEDEKKKMEGERDEAKKALAEATDETLSYGGQEIKKSVAGESQFLVMKAIADERDIERLEKRAATEFAHVPGTIAERAAVLKVVDGLPEDARKPFEAILAAAEKMIKAGFASLGARAGEMNDDVRKAVADFDGKVDEIAKRDSIPTFQAMQKARQEHPKLFEAYQEATGSGTAN